MPDEYEIKVGTGFDIVHGPSVTLDGNVDLRDGDVVITPLGSTRLGVDLIEASIAAQFTAGIVVALTRREFEQEEIQQVCDEIAEEVRRYKGP